MYDFSRPPIIVVEILSSESFKRSKLVGVSGVSFNQAASLQSWNISNRFALIYILRVTTTDC